MPKRKRIEAIAAEIADHATSRDDALMAVVEALTTYQLGHLDVVPLAEEVERLTGLRIVPRMGSDHLSCSRSLFPCL